MSINLLAIDLAKSIFQVHAVDENGRTVFKKKLSRVDVLPLTANMPKCRIAMESCGGSHFWAREFSKQGHTPCLIAAKNIKAFKTTTQKNDANDAEAIGEAAQRPKMRFVPIKSLVSQDLQSLHRVRNQQVKMRTAIVNQCRGLAMEYGETIPEGIANFRNKFPQILHNENRLTPIVQDLLEKQWELMCVLDKSIDNTEVKIKEAAKGNRDYARLMDVPGVGPLTASLFLASVGDVSVFKNGRHLSAWLGLVPRQHSSGGKTKLLGITKAGDQDLRVLMIHGARALLLAARKRNNTEDKWMLDLLEKKGWNKASVAVANKNCRIMHHLIKHQKEYDRKVA